MMMRWMTGALLAGTLLVSIPTAAQAQSNNRCFTQTGYCISGPIRSYWERNGGLPVFGYPMGPQQTTTVETWTGPAQQFERDRIEDHGTIGVLAGRLGAERLEQQGRRWVQGPGASAGTGPFGTNCRLFNETGYKMCDLFGAYWEQNGGLARFGYPITAPVQETIEGKTYWVQYFERRRMEWHPENAAPYNVLLGLLGNEIRAGTPSDNCSTAVMYELKNNVAFWQSQGKLGCPLPGQDYTYVNAARARFERGQMFWIQLRGGQSIVVALIYGVNGSVTQRIFADGWKEGDPINTGLVPPAGLLEPNRGFGKVWREHPELVNAIGWAVEHEKPENVIYQVFVRGSVLRPSNENVVWLLNNDGSAASDNVRW